MAREFPRFLFSNPTNVKSEGPFIIHTLEPQFIARPKFDKRRNIVDCKVLKVWATTYNWLSIHTVLEDIPAWFKHSGIQQSSNQDDILITAVQQLSFLRERSPAFSVEQAKSLINLLFPTKTKKIYEGSSSYGIKHFFEHVSEYIMGRDSYKYCNNETVKIAFEEEGYEWQQHGPNRYFNISAKEIHRAYRLFWIY